MELLSKLAKDENRTILAVTHDPRTIPYADRVIEIEDGLIIEQKEDAEAPAGAAKRKETCGRNRKNASKKKAIANA